MSIIGSYLCVYVFKYALTQLKSMLKGVLRSRKKEVSFKLEEFKKILFINDLN